MPRKRTWDPKSILDWREGRDNHRKKAGLLPIEGMSPDDKKSALEAEKHVIIESERALLNCQARPLGKRPPTAFIAPFSGTLLLPKHYRAQYGFDKVKFYTGDDLNGIVHRYYTEAVDFKNYLGDNYVNPDSIHVQRHEYMGPSPHVAAYRLTVDQAEIEWWEPFLAQAWIGALGWKVEAEFDDEVEGWFLLDRNDHL